MNILVIDDDLMMHKVLNHTLSALGHKIVEATDGQKALDYLKLERDIDIIICDIMMPDVTGPEFISHLKEYYNKWMPTVIVISSLDEGNEMLQKSGLKFSYFIHKPFEMSYLEGILEHIQKSKK
jgi:two-component system, chemotaxis family, chemotaxis protein CheY